MIMAQSGIAANNAQLNAQQPIKGEEEKTVLSAIEEDVNIIRNNLSHLLCRIEDTLVRAHGDRAVETNKCNNSPTVPPPAAKVPVISGHISAIHSLVDGLHSAVSRIENIV